MSDPETESDESILARLEGSAAETARAIREADAWIERERRVASRVTTEQFRDVLLRLAATAQELGRLPAVQADPELREAYERMMAAEDMPALDAGLDALIRRMEEKGVLRRPAGEIIGRDPAARRAFAEMDTDIAELVGEDAPLRRRMQL